jgi:hypothetical protein
MNLTLRQELERIAEQEKTSFSSLVSAICDSYLKTVKPQPKNEAEQPQQSQPQDTISPDDRKYMENIAKEWPNRPQDWREKQGRYIARTYGPEGQEFLQHLGDKP